MELRQLRCFVAVAEALADHEPTLEVRLQAVPARERAQRVAGGQVGAAFTHEVRPHPRVQRRRCGSIRCASPCRPGTRWPGDGSCG